MLDLNEVMKKNFSAFVDLVVRTESVENKNQGFRFPTSDFLKKTFNFRDNIEMFIDEATIRKILNFHGVSVDFIKQIPEFLNNENEEFISLGFKSKTQQDSSVIVSFEFVGNKPIIMPIAKEKRINTNEYVNKISSIYEKDNAEKTFKNWEEKDNLLLYKNSKRSLIFPNKTPTILYKKKGPSK